MSFYFWYTNDYLRIDYVYEWEQQQKLETRSRLEPQVGFLILIFSYFTNIHYLQTLHVTTTTIAPRNGMEAPQC